MTAFRVDDASLVRAAAAGDRPAFASIYDRYADALWGFCSRMLRNRADAEDCLQDVFVIAASRLGDLRQPEFLRSWLYAIARHECLARLDRHRHEVPMTDLFDPEAPTPEPDTDPELGALLTDAAGGLSDRDRLVLELADVQGLDGDALAEALGVPRATAYTLASRARATARTSIGALLVARTGRARCAELDQLLGTWDGRLTPLSRKQINRHIEHCATCTDQRERVAKPALILGGGWAEALPVALRSRILTAAAAVAGLVGGAVGWVAGWPPVDPILSGRERRQRLLLVVPLVLLLVLGVVGVGIWAATRPNTPNPEASGSVPVVIDASSGTGSALVTPSPTPTPSPTFTTTLTPTPTRTTTAASSSAPSTTAQSTAVTSSGRPTTSAATSSAPPQVWSLIVRTYGPPVGLVVGGKSTTCRQICRYPGIPDGTVIHAAINSLRRPPRTTFTDPPACAGKTKCTFVLIADTGVVAGSPIIF